MTLNNLTTTGVTVNNLTAAEVTLNYLTTTEMALNNLRAAEVTLNNLTAAKPKLNKLNCRAFDRINRQECLTARAVDSGLSFTLSKSQGKKKPKMSPPTLFSLFFFAHKPTSKRTCQNTHFPGR